MRFNYEIIIKPDGKYYTMDAPDLPGCCEWGENVEEVLAGAPDALETYIGAYLADGKDIPLATYGHKTKRGEVLAVISFEATAASVGAPSITATTAAGQLGISKGRVSQLLKEGRLDGYRDGREVMVTIASVERFAAIPRTVGRPRKELVAV